MRKLVPEIIRRFSWTHIQLISLHTGRWWMPQESNWKKPRSDFYAFQGFFCTKYPCKSRYVCNKNSQEQNFSDWILRIGSEILQPYNKTHTWNYSKLLETCDFVSKGWVAWSIQPSTFYICFLHRLNLVYNMKYFQIENESWNEMKTQFNHLISILLNRHLASYHDLLPRLFKIREAHWPPKSL